MKGIDNERVFVVTWTGTHVRQQSETRAMDERGERVERKVLEWWQCCLTASCLMQRWSVQS